MVKPFLYAVVLTGSIATGKSTAARFLKELGFRIIDADSIAHEVLNQQHKKIAILFGEHVVLEGIVNRKALGEIVFLDKTKRQELEQLLHPLIYQKIEEYAQKLDKLKRPYLVDIPLFYEHKRYPIDKSAVVYVPQEIQLQRLIQRDTMTEEMAKKRINMQIPIEIKVKNADYIIDNRGTLMDLKDECIRIKEKILKDFL